MKRPICRWGVMLMSVPWSSFGSSEALTARLRDKTSVSRRGLRLVTHSACFTCILSSAKKTEHGGHHRLFASFCSRLIAADRPRGVSSGGQRNCLRGRSSHRGCSSPRQPTGPPRPLRDGTGTPDTQSPLARTANTPSATSSPAGW